MSRDVHAVAADVVEQLTGRPVSECTWRELLRVRDAVAFALNTEVERAQADDRGRCDAVNDATPPKAGRTS